MLNKTIAIINNKGGVGKTTCTAGIANALASDGYKILLIDTDPQGNLSRLFGFEPKEDQEQSLYYCLNNKLKNAGQNSISFIKHTDSENIDILTGDINLTANRIEVERALAKFNFVYKKIVEDIIKEDVYDFILFDTCPSLGAENSQILVAVKNVIIPSTTGRNSVEGIDQLIDFYNNCREVNSDLTLLGILLNNVNKNSSIAKDIVPMLRNAYNNYIFDTIIERSVVAEKLEWGSNSASKNKISTAFKEVSEEVLKRIGYQKN